MKTCLAIVGTLAKSARLFAVVAMCLGATSAMAANYWKGVDGADLATYANWSENTLPTDDVGWFNGGYEHGTDYTVTLSKDVSFYQLDWGGSGTVVKSTLLDLGGHTLALTRSDKQPIRIENGVTGGSISITNGTLTFSTTTLPTWILGSNQTLTFGEGLTFNGSAAIHAAGSNPSTNTMIVAKDGAKVNGCLYFYAYQSYGTILITGEGTVMDANSTGALTLGSGSANSNNTCRVEHGAVVTNLSGGTAVDVGYTSQSRGNRLVVDSGASLYTKNWNVSGASDHTYLGRAGIHDGGNEIFVGDGAQLNTRVFNLYGTGNMLSISNGTFRAVKYEIQGTNTFHFAGSAPKLYQTGQNGCYFRAKCTYSFDVPATGYVSAPMDLYPGAAFTMTDDSILEVNVDAYREAGAGTVPLMKFRGGQVITFSDALLSRWNSELADKNCSVSYDSTERTLFLTVKKSGLTIFFR